MKANVPNLTHFSAVCLRLFLEQFPDFEPYVRLSEYEEGAWYAEMPWPDGWEGVGLCARTHGGHYGEEFRVDLGNYHQHFGDYEGSGTFEFLDEAFRLIERVLSEDEVLIAIWIGPSETVDTIRDSSFTPDEAMRADYGDCEVWRRSWNGTHNAMWKQSA